MVRTWRNAKMSNCLCVCMWCKRVEVGMGWQGYSEMTGRTKRLNSKGTIREHHFSFSGRQVSQAFSPLPHSIRKKAREQIYSVHYTFVWTILCLAWFNDCAFVVCHCLNPAQLVWQSKEHLDIYRPSSIPGLSRSCNLARHFSGTSRKLWPLECRAKCHPEPIFFICQIQLS
jgi:hypothetical protein